MTAFLDDTIYTNYALNKISENLVREYSNFNFLKVKIGSGDNSLDVDKEDLSATLYSLSVDVIEYKDGVLTIKCEIPPELAEVPITEIGLFDTFLGIDHLFSYSKVVIVKPADLNYELTIILNLGPRTIDFPGLNIIEIKGEDYATKEDLDKFISTFLYVATNTERLVRSNAGVIGLNKPQVVYKRQKDINAILREVFYANMFTSLKLRYGNDLTDTYFIHTPPYLRYKLNNYCDYDSYLDTSNGLFSSVNDNISFHNGPMTLCFTTRLPNLTPPIDDTTGEYTQCTLLAKKSPTEYYFSIDIQRNVLTYGPNQRSEEFNQLVITWWGSAGSYKLAYTFDMDNVYKYLKDQTPYIITFNGNLENPKIKLYINGEEPKIYNPNDITMPDEPKCRFGTIEYFEEDMTDSPDFSSIPLTNYSLDGANKPINYEYSLNMSSLLCLKKQVDLRELAFLNNTLYNMGQID